MTAAVSPARGAKRTARSRQVAWALAKRSLITTLRVPAAVLPLFLMPMFFVVIFSGRSRR